MATAKMLEFTIGLIIVVIVFFIIGGCVSKFLNPKCDLRADDAFEAFSTLYTNCTNKNVNGVCNCSEFDIQSLPPNYKISLTPFVEDEKESIRVSLVCNGRNAKNDYLENEKIRVYFLDPTKFEKASDLKIIRLHQDVGEKDKIGTKEFYWVYNTMGDKIRNEDSIDNPLYISDDILGNGFDIKNELNSHHVQDVGLLFGAYDKLTLVNYNGKVAFLARTPSQDAYLKKNSLPNC